VTAVQDEQHLDAVIIEEEALEVGPVDMAVVEVVILVFRVEPGTADRTYTSANIAGGDATLRTHCHVSTGVERWPLEELGTRRKCQRREMRCLTHRYQIALLALSCPPWPP
jgi:hypothetical protein